MERIASWCPNCGKTVSDPYPFCVEDGSPTPLYIEVNVLAQYLVGTPTFVEFRLTNASDDPLSLETFRVSLGSHLLASGIHEAPEKAVIEPGGGGVLVLDRKVELGFATVVPGSYQFNIAVAFTCRDAHYDMTGVHTVVFDHPGARRIHAHDPSENVVRVFEGDSYPEGHALLGFAFGEQTQRTPGSGYICRLKDQAGLQFVPVHMRYVAANHAAANHAAAWDSSERCALCGAVPVEGGPYCHACGRPRTSIPSIPKPSPDEVVAYCPHCAPPGGVLRGRHRFCPVCGERIHVYVEMNQLPFYMEGVQTETRCWLHAVHEGELKVQSASARLGGKEIPSGTCRLSPGRTLTSHSQPMPMDWMVYPAPGEPLGHRIFQIELTYDVDGRPYQASARQRIHVLPKVQPKDVQINMGDRDVTIGDTSSGGTRYYKVDVHAFDNKSDVADYIKELLGAGGVSYEHYAPVRLEVMKAVAPPASMVARDWAPMERARVWFKVAGVVHNYCLVSKAEVHVGRSADWADIRLYEMERYLAERRRLRQQGIMDADVSQVSRRLWVLTVTGNGIRFTHLPGNLVWLGPGGKRLEENDTVLVGRNETMAIPQVLGVQYAANAPMFDQLEVARVAARAILDRMPQRPEARAPWPGPFGGYRLSRLHSLTGENVPGYEEFRALEAYVLMPGWATIGASKNACIVVPQPNQGVKDVHAYILFLDGYYFLFSHRQDARTTLNGECLEANAVRPLRPGDKIELGGTILTFDTFCQQWL